MMLHRPSSRPARVGERAREHHRPTTNQPNDFSHMSGHRGCGLVGRKRLAGARLTSASLSRVARKRWAPWSLPCTVRGLCEGCSAGQLQGEAKGCEAHARSQHADANMQMLLNTRDSAQTHHLRELERDLRHAAARSGIKQLQDSSTPRNGHLCACRQTLNASCRVWRHTAPGP